MLVIKKNHKRIFKETSWIIFGQIIFVLGSVYLIKILTDLLEPKEYGVLTLILSLNGLFVQALFSSITPGSTRFFSIAESNDELSYYYDSLYSMTASLTKIILFFSTLFIILSFFFLKNYNLFLISILVIIYSSFNGYNSIFNSIHQAKRNHNLISLNQILDISLKVFISILLINLFGKKSINVLVSYTIVVFLIFLVNLFIIKKDYKIKSRNKIKNPKWVKDIWNYSWPFVLWGIFTTAQLYSDRWALKFYTSDFEIGLYSIVYQYGFTLMTTASGIFITLLTPILFHKIESKNLNEYEKMMKNILYIGITISILAFLFFIITHKFLFNYFVDHRYSSVSYLLPWMVLSGGLNSVGQAYSLKLMAEKKVLKLLPIKIITSVIGFLLNVFGAKYFLLQGIVCANLLFSIIYLITIYYFSINNSKIKLINISLT